MPKAQESVDRKGGVSQPGVAIVPVANPADLLGQSEGQRRNYGTVLTRGQQLQDKSGAVDYFTPAAAVGRAPHPAAPVVGRFLECGAHIPWMGGDAVVAV